MCLSQIPRGFWGRARSVNADRLMRRVGWSIKNAGTDQAAQKKTGKTKIVQIAALKNFSDGARFAQKSARQKIGASSKSQLTLIENGASASAFFQFDEITVK